jgi:hypothetical protein
MNGIDPTLATAMADLRTQDCSVIAEIQQRRLEIEKLIRSGCWTDEAGTLKVAGTSGALARQIILSGRHMGLSGEDTMTWLVHELLKHNDRLEKMVLQVADSNPMKSILFP